MGGANLIEKVLARASGRAKVTPGEIVVADVDSAMVHDLSCCTSGRIFEADVGGTVKNADRIAVIFDHIFSPPTEDKAQVLEFNRAFCRKYGLSLYDSGSGNLHNVAMRRGHARPGSIVVGSDSHSTVHGVIGAMAVSLGNYSFAATVMPYGKAWFRVPELVSVELVGQPPRGTTARDVALWLTAQIGEGNAKYAAIRFEGEYIDSLSFWERWLFTLLGVDVGAKCMYIEPDDETARVAAQLGLDDSQLEHGDRDAVPSARWRWDVSEVPPVVACPATVGNVRPVSEVAGTPVQFCELGGHGGGRTEDVELAASVFAGHQRADGVLFNIVPSSRDVFAECLEKGLVEPLHAGGATWFPASGGSNQAINMGAMTKDEAMISTQSRNFPGRNGNREARMYLASPLTVAATAMRGVITDPREFL